MSIIAAATFAIATPQGPALVPIDSIAPPVPERAVSPERQCPGLAKWRLANAAANLADIASTVYIIESGKGTEGNPLIRGIFGSRPEWYEVGAFKVAYFGFSELVSRRAMSRGDCAGAVRPHKIAAIVTGGIVAWNLTIAVK